MNKFILFFSQNNYICPRMRLILTTDREAHHTAANKTQAIYLKSIKSSLAIIQSAHTNITSRSPCLSFPLLSFIYPYPPLPICPPLINHRSITDPSVSPPLLIPTPSQKTPLITCSCCLPPNTPVKYPCNIA